MSIPNEPSDAQLWTAIAHVKPNPGNDVFQGAPGAFIPVIVLAADAREVFSKVKHKVNSYDFMLARIEDIEPLSKESSASISPELLRRGSSLTPEKPVALGSFHSYENGP